jgi:dCMP deaminase
MLVAPEAIIKQGGRNMRPDWNEYFMIIAKIVSSRSTCNSRPAGAVLIKDKQILATGYNGAVPGGPHCIDEAVDETGIPFCFRRSIGAPEMDKYNFCRATHAEANAIAQAARCGIPVEGATLFVTLAPCYSCLKLLSTARIHDIYYEYDYESTDRMRDDFWRERISESGIVTFKQLRVPDDTIRAVLEQMKYPTSQRKLSEDGMIIETTSAWDASRVTTTFREGLLATLLSAAGLDKKTGNRMDFALTSEMTSIPDGERKEAIEYLKNIGLISGDSLGASTKTRAVIEHILTRGLEATISEDSYSLSVNQTGEMLDVTFRVQELDLLEQYPAFINAAKLVYDDIYMALVDRMDMSLKRGTLHAVINSPFVRSSMQDQAKQVLLKA